MGPDPWGMEQKQLDDLAIAVTRIEEIPAEEETEA